MQNRFLQRFHATNDGRLFIICLSFIITRTTQRILHRKAHFHIDGPENDVNGRFEEQRGER